MGLLDFLVGGERPIGGWFGRHADCVLRGGAYSLPNSRAGLRYSGLLAESLARPTAGAGSPHPWICGAP